MAANSQVGMVDSAGQENADGRTAFRLLGLTALVVVMVLARVVYTGQPTHVHVLWNLFLAWLPFAFAHLALQSGAAPGPVRLGFGLAWLLFLPNAPYLITDLGHLQRGTGVPLVYDVLLLFGAAMCGLVLGLVSLRYMLAATAQRLGLWASRLLGPVVLGATGFGIYLGRYLRWNSWDALLRPVALARDVWQHVRHPVQHWQAWALVLLLATLLGLAYGLLMTAGRARPEKAAE
jgi:uncharacterized membrane protein